MILHSCGLILTFYLEPALPTIVAQFHALHDMGAYGSAYLLPQCVLHPTCNKLYSMYSFSSVYISSILIFVGTSFNSIRIGGQTNE